MIASTPIHIDLHSWKQAILEKNLGELLHTMINGATRIANRDRTAPASDPAPAAKRTPEVAV
jgi:hypothetical protein